MGNQAGNSLQITIQGESGEGRARGARWPPESGWGQAVLLVRAGGGEQGKTSSYTKDMQEAQACEGIGGGVGMRSGSASSMSSTLRGPSWSNPPGFASLCMPCPGTANPTHLPGSELAGQPVSTPLLWG